MARPATKYGHRYRCEIQARTARREGGSSEHLEGTLERVKELGNHLDADAGRCGDRAALSWCRSWLPPRRKRGVGGHHGAGKERRGWARARAAPGCRGGLLARGWGPNVCLRLETAGTKCEDVTCSTARSGTEQKQRGKGKDQRRERQEGLPCGHGARGYTASSDWPEIGPSIPGSGGCQQVMQAGAAGEARVAGAGVAGEGGLQPPAQQQGQPAQGRHGHQAPPAARRQAAQGRKTAGRLPQAQHTEDGKPHSSRGGVSTRGWVNTMLQRKQGQERAMWWRAL